MGPRAFVATVGALAVGVMSTACAPGRGSRHSGAHTATGPAAGGKPRTVRASAPSPAIDVTHLGVAYDQAFNPIPGGPLFASQPHYIQANEMRHELAFVETAEDFAANAKAWGLGSANIGMDGRSRFGSYRAYQVTHVAELDDSAPMRRPPPGSVYYPWRIFFGYSYEEVIVGDARSFNAGVKLNLGKYSGAIGAFTSSNNLTSRMAGRGLRPASGKAIFARTPEEIRTTYSQDGPPVPIFVEYRQLPYTQALTGQVQWMEPLDVEIRFSDLVVGDDGTAGSTPWVVLAFCLVNGGDFPIHSRDVLNGRVEDPHTYPLTWVERLSLFPGDVVECGTQGTLHDHITSPRPIGRGKMEPISVQPNLAVNGAFRGSNASSRYDVRWSVRVVPRASQPPGAWPVPLR